MNNKFFKFLSLIVVIIFMSLKLFAAPGGVLPYYYDNKGNVFFLLGREAGGKDKGTWADFGGGKTHGESTAQTAAREAHEETVGVFDMLNRGWNPKKYGPQKGTEEGIQFWLKKFPNSRKAVTSKVKATTYFVNVTNQVNKAGPSTVITYLNNIRNKQSQWKYKEKNSFKWVNGKKFKNAILGNDTIGLRNATKGIIGKFGTNQLNDILNRAAQKKSYKKSIPQPIKKSKQPQKIQKVKIQQLYPQHFQSKKKQKQKIKKIKSKLDLVTKKWLEAQKKKKH